MHEGGHYADLPTRTKTPLPTLATAAEMRWAEVVAGIVHGMLAARVCSARVLYMSRGQFQGDRVMLGRREMLSFPALLKLSFSVLIQVTVFRSTQRSSK